MNSIRIQHVALAAAIAVITIAPLVAQEHAEHQQAAKPAAKTATPEIFCATMKTGALCPTGTVGALSLSGQKQEQWLAAVQRYNKAVTDATTQLQADAKGVLTPAQIAQVNKWFAVGMNVQINQLLASSK